MILVTGASGANGGAVVRKLAERGIPVRALVRNPEKANGLAGLQGVEIVMGDMAQPASLATPLRGVDRALLISSSDPAMLDVQANFIAAAKQAGVRHVVKLSGIMPERDSAFRFARMHGEIEQRLEASGMAFTHLRAGEFMQAYFRQIPQIASKGAIFLPMDQAKIASVDIADLAIVAVAVLTEPGHEGKAYPLTGPEALTMTEVAEKLSAAVGKPVRYIPVPPEDARRANLAAGMPSYLADALFELFAERRNGKEAQVSLVIPSVFGLKATGFGEFAARHAAVFRGEQPPPKV